MEDSNEKETKDSKDVKEEFNEDKNEDSKKEDPNEKDDRALKSKPKSQLPIRFVVRDVNFVMETPQKDPFAASFSAHMPYSCF